MNEASDGGTPGAPAGAASHEAVLAAAALAARVGRDDLADRLAIAAARMTRPATIVCVVGEFKKGKSTLVNAATQVPVCPVDDDLATSAITLVRYGEQTEVQVRHRDGERVVVEVVDPGSIAEWVTEAGNPDNAKGVERVDVAAPSALLAGGLCLVDTPGMGSLGAGHAASTLAFLPFADGLVFVSDSSAELSKPEADFLQRATELCPNVLFALTKTDLHAHWERIAELDRGHLARLGSDVTVTPVSSALRAEALGRGDEALDALSGFPDLLGSLRDRIVEPAKVLATARGEAEAHGVLDQIAGSAAEELAVLGDPDRGRALAAGLATAADRLEHLKGPGARWAILVADRVADLSNDASYRFRAAMRSLTRTVEDRIEELKTPKDWEELSRDLQTLVADAVTDVFASIERGAQDIREAVVDLLAEESMELPPLRHGTARVDARALWSSKALEQGGKGRLTDAMTGMRGAQSGILMFGMMSEFLPRGIATFIALSPVMLGIGAAFAGIQLVDAHKRKVQARRQQARANVHQFVDDVQFEVGNELSELLRSVQRSIRDEFTERVGELQRTYSELHAQTQEAAERDEAANAARRVDLEAVLAEADRITALLVGA